MDYKDTLLMPNTQFEMRGNLTVKEPNILAKWEEMRLYDLMVEQNKEKPYFMLHDGPPYANGNLHMGTAMNRVLKDFIVKSKHMMGYNTPFYPGWDTHGLPIENAMPKLGYDRKKMSVAEFRQKCDEYAHEQIKIQMATEKRLGAVADYDNPYITLHKSFEADQIRTFGKMACKGLIFQGLKPIYWSCERESAVADSEIYYQDKKDMTIFVAFDVVDGKGILDGDERFVIWTTTPWTIPANMAVCLHPNLEYAVVKTAKGKLVVSNSLVAKLMSKFELEEYEILKTFKGSQLEYITVKHPLYDRTSLVIVGDHVTDEDGTGCVHTAGGHGVDDFYVCQKYGIPPFCPVDDKGLMMSEAGERIEGMFVFDANKEVINWLDENNALLARELITHSYPHDERMKKPIIFRATVQWFASIEKIRKELLDAIDSVKWENDFGHIRIYNMIKDRGDWCISRQRVWGVPIPIFYGEDNKPIIDEVVFEHVAKLFEEYGSNIWFEKEAKDLLPAGYTNEHSPNGLFTKEKDIMDVWFDSGSSHNTFKRRGYPYPCDMYMEGSDQYRGWFNSSLCVGVATNGQAPYKSVLSHGYVVESKGIKMSKSLGNVVNPIDVINKYGADILRLWVSSVDFRADLKCSDELFKINSEQYRKIRNTFKFLLGNIEQDFDVTKDAVAYENLTELDKYILAKLNKVINDTIAAYNNYNYIDANNTMFTFMSNTMSSFYMDYAKDILYIEKKDSLRRRQIQTVFYQVVDALVRLWAPILSFTMEEVYSIFQPNGKKSIFLELFPVVVNHDDEQAITQKWDKFMLVRNDILKALEEARNAGLIKKALEAKILLNVKEEYKDTIVGLTNHDLAQLVIASQFEVTNDFYQEYNTCYVNVVKAEGCICPRCWNVVTSADENGLCDRCHDVLVG